MEASHPSYSACQVRDPDADAIADHDHTISATPAGQAPVQIATTISIPEPLLSDRRARVTLRGSEDVHWPEEDSIALSRCIDTIESALDPRPDLTHEIAKCRPKSVHAEKARTATADLPTNPPININRAMPVGKEASLKNLTAVLHEVSSLRNEFNRRREESLQIQDLLTQEIQQMTRKISDLEQHVHELQMDIEEERAEREGLQGTVHGLISWVEAWQEQRDQASYTTRTQKSGLKRWSKRKDKESTENGSEALLDGISAWSRGWKDAEEEFRIRASERKFRRDGRQSSHVNIGESAES
ncbi:uncharacterized protein ACLA_085840 [Aspergillus clavatus NRRL 1]|uniref:Uncharacterized protein n=1 Tax=Aspergillus clavatus (strain ATCC 1007 / CBS 513.65 / DSM 816 / NCTC 3887 / NRRL 1 / QM 1276 / 107) TaxID=344612 RepID=A1CUA0_ASPCL|nr:uncharacterized protein ACLA_085840 [Aspergillus clavatus NRRL 1]EAW06887.1 hypothetical protein ACLA_085840 [Aspergillus clavatus NRRL 1]